MSNQSSPTPLGPLLPRRCLQKRSPFPTTIGNFWAQVWSGGFRGGSGTHSVGHSRLSLPRAGERPSRTLRLRFRSPQKVQDQKCVSFFVQSETFGPILVAGLPGGVRDAFRGAFQTLLPTGWGETFPNPPFPAPEPPKDTRPKVCQFLFTIGDFWANSGPGASGKGPGRIP